MIEPVNEQIWEEASAWFVEFRTGGSQRDSRDEFMQWLRRSPDHVRAYIEISQTYLELPAPATVPSVQIQRLLDKTRARCINEVVSISPRGVAAAALGSTPARRLFKLPLTLAACFGLLSAIGMTVWSLTQRGLYSTTAGEQRTVTLTDGSRIELNGRTRLRVSYSTHGRDVELLEGQAFFQVAKDKTRPFIVATDTARIRAVGTAFDVYRRHAETTVTVIEGAVAVVSAVPPPTLSNQRPPSSNVVVTAGEATVVSSSGSRKPGLANVQAATAWTRGQLEFQETPLAQVAEEFNRSSPRPLSVDSVIAGQVRINGIYSSVDPAALVLFLRNQPDLEVTETPDQIVVRSRTP